ncbi:alpha/beta hydrolase [Rathayibacter iranicus]|uniref:Esterase n=2 Tax=Rathayibacter iranicus TaxID=59737 RepID=A0AAD1AC69_9MICO|nr:alpha/beta hydrolase-fold protein [Rathayibacter iranicus]AZZ54715.1 hypothetical protein C7V51_01550 [Rathayibacter iranicus]MWV30504.1 hypothetical protein [Rathayibacter iranicus NCPPB 2253 = VKM Ac-1602]PPI50972.1 hypothetical protein C5E09_01595 [Rathayibacter iranicus]PPI62912.1 hypothetical protein C5E08_01595 [Rathayibacter iranicus]PPI74204.1 hypothetical protein C5E01_01575 [Rathayibacter iranicus]
MLDTLLSLQLLTGRIPKLTFAAACLALIVLLVRRYDSKRLRALTIGIFSGAAAGVLLLVVVEGLLNSFGTPLSAGTHLWVVAFTAGTGLAVASMLRAALWRRLVAIVAVISFLIAAGIGINLDYGLTATPAEILGTSTVGPIALPPLRQPDAPVQAPDGTPNNRPAHGEIGTTTIPAEVSGFPARKAGIYLPPAALQADPPNLPVVVMMMGQPGTTDPTRVGKAMDAVATAHGGWSPIVVIADQIGRPVDDPLCSDVTSFGAAQTYVSVDVVNWIRSSLNVLPDPSAWTVAGYSNGGTCAALLGAKFPNVFKNAIGIAGEAFPGQDQEEETLANALNGDAALYDSLKPARVLAVSGADYSQSWQYFTVGQTDGNFAQWTRELADSAEAAGVTTEFEMLHNEGHGGAALDEALPSAFAALTQRLEQTGVPGAVAADAAH